MPTPGSTKVGFAEKCGGSSKLCTVLFSKVRHPLGVTERFPVERGVAQGAVESPWIYSQFIEGLSAALKSESLGVMFAGRRIPLLMYAGDMVLFAHSQSELARMNAVASRFAQQHRFQYNGRKSGVMAFNVSAEERGRAEQRRWLLSGEQVKVVDSYEYLGTILPSDGLSWKPHLKKVIASAERRSADLLWMCRVDKGLRPRTAVTLWQALVRPILEYASELWSGQIPGYLVDQAEKVQMTFLRGTLGLHGNGSGVSDEMVRAEAGCERLQDRWAKLRLGYWRRIFISPHNRLLRIVAQYRNRERIEAKGSARGSKGWMPSAEITLTTHGMPECWTDTQAVRAVLPAEWKAKCFQAVDKNSNQSRQERMSGMTSAVAYNPIKCWDTNPEMYSFSSGEVGRIGQHVPEIYLDDRTRLKGTRLKLLCRLGCLPVMDRIGREVIPRWPKYSRICFGFREGQITHFLMTCPVYAKQRGKLFSRVTEILANSNSNAGPFWDMDREHHRQLLLGKRIGDPIAETKVDIAVKHFLIKAWNKRSCLTRTINSLLGTNYEAIRSRTRVN